MVFKVAGRWLVNDGQNMYVGGLMENSSGKRTFELAYIFFAAAGKYQVVRFVKVLFHQHFYLL